MERTGKSRYVIRNVQLPIHGLITNEERRMTCFKKSRLRDAFHFFSHSRRVFFHEEKLKTKNNRERRNGSRTIETRCHEQKSLSPVKLFRDSSLAIYQNNFVIIFLMAFDCATKRGKNNWKLKSLSGSRDRGT